MLQNWTIIIAALGYIGFLFLIASYGDRIRGPVRAHARSLIYPLSLALYCTSWTFFGSVGLASRSGTDFLAIYVGPAIMIGLCTPLLLRIINLAKSQNITSIADFVAARYGKSQAVAATVALIAIFGSIPYIALQLKAVSASLETMLGDVNVLGVNQEPIVGDLALMVAFAMAVFAVLFGTRHADATEHQDGMMLAVATESIVKLVAFLAVGFLVTFWIFDGPMDIFRQAQNNAEAARSLEHSSLSGTFLTMTLLSFFAIVLLPRQFHVTVVENYNTNDMRRARWIFPLYLVAINIFVIPIALAGVLTIPFGNFDSDMYVLALPIKANSQVFTMAAFIGGLSAATAMVIVESVALAIMVSNDLIVPMLLKRRAAAGSSASDIGQLLLTVRRIAIFAIMLLAYVYYRSAGSAQLASIGLLSFAAVAQFAPAFFGGLFWRRATGRGAIGGMVAGFLVWAYTLLLPSFADAGIIGKTLIAHGPWGLSFLRPQALLGTELPPLVHGVVWSLGINLIAYLGLSFSRRPSSIEQLQADIFVPNELAPIAPNFRLWRSSITVNDLTVTIGQYLGPQRTRAAMEAFAAANNLSLDPASPADFRLLRHAEHLIASAIGAASSRLVVSLLLRKRTMSAKAALKLLDDAHAAIYFNREILQTALDHVRQGLAVFNRDMQLICANRKFGEILDLPASIAQVGIDLEEILQTMGRKIISSDEELSRFVADRLAIYTAPGEPFLERFPRRGLVVEVRTNRMPDGGFVITFSDITASVEAAEALERANATLERRVRERTQELMRLNSELARAKIAADDANISKTRFLAAASHDILQPLNAARLYVTSLVERQRTNASDATLVNNIDESLEAIEDIIGALLDISRLDAGAMTATFTNFRIGDLLRNLEVEFAPIAAAKKLKLTFVPCSLAIASDRSLLRRLLQNLISNAIKYTPQGRVLVGCRLRGNSVDVEIFDTGVGIPSERRREIFKEFHRLEQGAKIARGLGLGLSIVERIARVLGHSISVNSNAKRGSHFSVRIAVAVGSTQQASASLAPRSVKHDLSGLLVLCVDNEPAILNGMRLLLEGWGARVTTATDAASALAALTANGERPDGVLVDYHLDRGTGLSAIRELRRLYGATLPAALITADRSPFVRKTAADDNIPVFSKPIKPAALRALLAQWHSRRAVAAE